MYYEHLKCYKDVEKDEVRVEVQTSVVWLPILRGAFHTFPPSPPLIKLKKGR